MIEATWAFSSFEWWAIEQGGHSDKCRGEEKKLNEMAHKWISWSS